MYIRRKVFSALVDESGEERLFSTTDYVLDQHMYAEETALAGVAAENTAKTVKGKRKILDALKANKDKVVEWAKKNPKTAIAVGAGTVGVGTAGALALHNRKKRKQAAVAAQKEFGLKSKALYAITPGGYQAKEALKYGYDPTDAKDMLQYQKERGNYALRGALTPITALAINRKASKMAKEGKSKKEIREYLKDNGDKRVLAGLSEIAGTAAAVYGGKKTP